MERGNCLGEDGVMGVWELQKFEKSGCFESRGLSWRHEGTVAKVLTRGRLRPGAVAQRMKTVLAIQHSSGTGLWGKQ